MLRLLIPLFLAATAAQADFSGRINVIDGDTFDVGDRRVRLFAVDAPERDQTCTRANGAQWDCGRWVVKEVRNRLQGRQATCKAVELDQYNRTVAKCRVQGRDVGEWLVGEGLIFSFPRYGQDYVGIEKEALVAGRGLHQGTFQTPSDFRASKRVVTLQSPPSECAIKGNIGSKGTRIYHMPGQADYDKTRISEKNGERWFCTEVEAKKAGWRRAAR